jgi:spore maturation protein CgeB
MVSIPELRVLYVGDLWQGSTCLQRMNAMRDLVLSVDAVDTAPDHVRMGSRRLSRRILTRIAGPRDWAGANAQILSLASEGRHDLLWVDKGVSIKPSALRAFRRANPSCVCAGYSPDDMMARHNRSRRFLRQFDEYDLFFTTKSYHVEELGRLGRARIVFVDNAFDRYTHTPSLVDASTREALGGPVGFIGFWEEARANSLLYLAQAGIRVRVWGPGWEHMQRRDPRLQIEGRPLWAADYAKAICAFDINLGFLRKMNRDLQTQRSVEIPACGGFMLAERTDEHCALFREGHEAEFFDSNDELLTKVKYYLANSDRRREIAARGRQRCVMSGYSNHERMRFMLSNVEAARSGVVPHQAA